MVWLKRMVICLIEIALALDQLVQTIMISPFYIIVGDDPPSADESLSSRIGRYAERGYRAAIVAEWAVDRLFWLFTGRLNHCREHIEVRSQDSLADRPVV